MGCTDSKLQQRNQSNIELKRPTQNTDALKTEEIPVINVISAKEESHDNNSNMIKTSEIEIKQAQSQMIKDKSSPSKQKLSSIIQESHAINQTKINIINQQKSTVKLYPNLSSVDINTIESAERYFVQQIVNQPLQIQQEYCSPRFVKEQLPKFAQKQNLNTNIMNVKRLVQQKKLSTYNKISNNNGSYIQGQQKVYKSIKA